MTPKQEAALRQAREALNGSQYRMNQYGYQAMETTIAANNAAIAAIDEALAEQPAQQEQEQETVMAEYKFQTYAAYKTEGEMKIGLVPDDAPLTLNGVPLYPRREWQGLTDEEYKEAEKAVWAVIAFDDTEKKANREFYEAIEAKLREKNA